MCWPSVSALACVWLNFVAELTSDLKRLYVGNVCVLAKRFWMCPLLARSTWRDFQNPSIAGRILDCDQLSCTTASSTWAWCFGTSLATIPASWASSSIIPPFMQQLNRVCVCVWLYVTPSETLFAHISFRHISLSIHQSFPCVPPHKI